MTIQIIRRASLGLNPGMLLTLPAATEAALVADKEAIYATMPNSRGDDLPVRYDPTTGTIVGPSGESLSGTAAQVGGINPANRCVLLGDSITQYNNLETSNATANQSRGYMVWANALLGRRRLNVVANLGVGGDTTTMMLARVSAAAAVDARWAVVLGGINDLAGNLTAPGIVTANLQAIYVALLASGKRVIAVSVLPVTSAHPLYSLGLVARISQVNRWIASYCAATPGMVFVDGASAVIDPASAAGDPISGTYADVTHIGSAGAYLVGKALADAVRESITPIVDAPSGVVDTYVAAQRTVTSLTGDGTTATGTLTAHNLLAGDKITIEGATPSGYNGSWTVATAPTTSTFTFACTAASGAATGTIKVSNNDQLLTNPLFGTPSGGLASSWTVTESATTTTPTTSARSDGRGNWQQLAITASGSGSVYIQGGDPFTSVFPGDVVVLETEVECDASPTALEGIQANLNMIVGGVTYTPAAFNRLAGSAMPTVAWAGLIRTEPFTVPAGAVTRCRPQLRVFFSGAGSATVRFGTAALRKVR